MSGLSNGHNNTEVPGAGTMGMYLLITSLGMLFVAGIIGYWVIRLTNQPWPPPGFPVLPRSLWFSTLVIITSSVTIQRAIGAILANQLKRLKYWLLVTFGLGILFLLLQGFAWWEVVRQITQPSENLGSFIKLFYVLTGLHAAHVLGGLLALGIVLVKAWREHYSAYYHPGPSYCAIYWHFLDVVWVVLFVVVYLI